MSLRGYTFVCFFNASTAENSRLLVRKGLMGHFVVPGILPIRCLPHLCVLTSIDELGNKQSGFTC